MAFADAVDAFFINFFRHYPMHATSASNHEHDHLWPDLTDAGTQDCLAWLADARAGLEAADGLTREEEMDRRVLLTQIDELRFDEEDLDESSWSPIVYSYLLGGPEPRYDDGAGASGGPMRTVWMFVNSQMPCRPSSRP